MVDICIYCGEPIHPDDDPCDKEIGQTHFECSEIEDPDELD